MTSSKRSDSVRAIPGPWIPAFAGMTERCGGFSRDPLKTEQLRLAVAALQCVIALCEYAGGMVKN